MTPIKTKENGERYIEIACRFCGAVSGEQTISPNMHIADDLDPMEALGIEESRCDDCVKEHGTLQEMQAVHRTIYGQNHDAKAFSGLVEKAGGDAKKFAQLLASQVAGDKTLAEIAWVVEAFEKGTWHPTKTAAELDAEKK